MKVAPNNMLKTKGQKSAPNEFMKTNDLRCFLDELLKGKMLTRNCCSRHAQEIGKVVLRLAGVFSSVRSPLGRLRLLRGGHFRRQQDIRNIGRREVRSQRRICEGRRMVANDNKHCGSYRPRQGQLLDGLVHISHQPEP